ncbi:MAG: SH3 domain-containing protein [Candidatus Promineifilaceae bacterium]
MTDKRAISIVLLLVLFLAGFSAPEAFAALDQPVLFAQTDPTSTPRPTSTPSATQTPTSDSSASISEDDIIVRIAVASANLRSGPGLQFAPIAVVLFNDAFIIQEVDQSGLWYRITTAGGEMGWVTKSVTEEVSAEVYEALISTPEPESETEPEPTTESDVDEEITPEPTEEPVSLNVRVTYSSVNVRGGPGLQYDILGFAYRDDVYEVKEEHPFGWLFVELEDGTEGWLAGSVVDLTTDDPFIAPRPIPVVTEGDGSGGGGLPTSDGSEAAASTTSIERDGDRIRPGSPLVFDTDGSGHGAAIAVAPSGPDPRILNDLPSKPATSGGFQPSADYLPGDPSIMMLGDGITSGTRPIANGYRRALYGLLDTNNYHFSFVGSKVSYTSPPDYNTNHEGHPGYRADQLLAGLSRWVSEDTAPDILLLHAGTNDILQGEGVESTVQDLRLIILTMRYFNPNVKVLISKIIPTSDPVVNQQISALNVAINRISYTMNTGNSQVLIVDQYSGFDADRLTYDGIHPNIQGAEKIANNFYSALVRYTFIRK